MSRDSTTVQLSKRNWGFRFSLSTLLLVMLAVAIFLGGRASMTYRYALAPSLAGSWRATLPRGFVQLTTIQDFGEERFLVRSQASIFSGIYKWRNGQLVAVEPEDTRMVGLIWKWDGTRLTLVAEPKNTPTGSSYVGTVLTATAGNPAP